MLPRLIDAELADLAGQRRLDLPVVPVQLHQHGLGGRHFDQPLEVRAQLGIRKPDFVAEATLSLAGRTLHADANAQDMYAAIDLLADKLDRLLLKQKERMVDHHRGEGIAHVGTAD